MARDYSTIGLYDHNIYVYEKVAEAYKNGKKTVGIIQATGTGKTYIALQLCYDNKDKKITYVVPSLAIKEHILQIIKDNPNLDLKRDFPNLTIRTYSEFVNKSRIELENLEMDLLILDEFHHLGAPVWGARVNTIIDTHPDLSIFGMTAYSVRDRNTSYERDMAEEGADEIFSDNIVRNYDLCDAILDGVLPKFRYMSVHERLNETADALSKKLSGLNKKSEPYKDCAEILEAINDLLKNPKTVADLIKKAVKPGGKYYYFCPPQSIKGINDIDTIKKEAYEWFKSIAPEKDIVFYTSTSYMGEEGKKNREAFYNDVDLDGNDCRNKLRVMFAINQYNEGTHAPNVDGVILGRGTSSDIVYFEQIGRALSVADKSEKYKELSKLSDSELFELAKEIGINSRNREEIMEALLSPVIIDLVDNYDYIKELQNDLKYRIKMPRDYKAGHHHRIYVISPDIDIEIENQDIYEMLTYVFDRLYKSWDDIYEMAKNYYNQFHNLNIKYAFKTVDGCNYDPNGFKLGAWLDRQRKLFARNALSEDKVERLLEIGAVLGLPREIRWETFYNLAINYFNRYGNLRVPLDFKTVDGINNCPDYEDAFYLGNWISRMRVELRKGTLSSDRVAKLEKIGMKPINLRDFDWKLKYGLAQKYFEENGHLDIPSKCIVTTEDGTKIALGEWLHNQKRVYNSGKMPKGRADLLLKIGIVFETKDNEAIWHQKYHYLKRYFEENNTTVVPVNYISNGVNLYTWLNAQLTFWRNGKLNSERIMLLEEIGVTKDYFIEQKWRKYFDLLRAYYSSHGNLLIPTDYRTLDGINPNESGINLGRFIVNLRSEKKQGNVPQERIEALDSIGMIWSVVEYKTIFYETLEAYGIPDKDIGKKLYGIPINILVAKLEYLLANGIQLIINGKINDIFTMTEQDLLDNYNISLSELIKQFGPQKEEVEKLS